MSVGHYTDSMDNKSYLMTPELTSPLYDGTSSDSSASSPMNCHGFDTLYAASSYMAYPAFPMPYPMAAGESMTALGLIPVELDIEALYEDHDRRRKKNGSEKTVSSHVHSRRRAQNRASQRAFRDRKEKHMRELEQRLGELEGRHSDLSRSYESLQIEYANVKQELDRMRQDGSSGNRGGPGSSSRSSQSQSSEWEEETKSEILDPLLFDVSAFCFDQDGGPKERE